MTTVENVSVSRIKAGPNDRTIFNEDALETLAANIAEHGLIQPITVRPSGKLLEIVAGERRFRAVKSLGWDEVPVMVVDLVDEAASAVMLAENVARADLDPIDEAVAYQSRIDLYGWTPEVCAERGGVTVGRVKSRIRLLTLREDVAVLVRSGDLLLGYASVLAGQALDSNRQLIAIGRLRDNPAPQIGWFRRVVADLFAEQSQEELFCLEAVAPAPPVVDDVADPPRPGIDEPPRVGDTLAEIIENQAVFWDECADRWQLQGKAFPRNECQAAARALRALAEGGL